ncbi:MAG: DUF4156 domain-containing protein [Pseudohongiellaceae bacterium]
MIKILPMLMATLVLSSCSSLVELTDAGRNVAVRMASQVANCTRTGDTTVSVLDRVLIQRSEERVMEELEILARNAAANRGDTIVATTPVTDGERTYTIYRCID